MYSLRVHTRNKQRVGHCGPGHQELLSIVTPFVICWSGWRVVTCSRLPWRLSWIRGRLVSLDRKLDPRLSLPSPPVHLVNKVRKLGSLKYSRPWYLIYWCYYGVSLWELCSNALLFCSNYVTFKSKTSEEKSDPLPIIKSNMKTSSLRIKDYKHAKICTRPPPPQQMKPLTHSSLAPAFDIHTLYVLHCRY